MSEKRTNTLSETYIIELLDEILDVEFSFIRTEIPAAVIAKLERLDQDFILNWVKRVASMNIQLANQFIEYIIDAVAYMDKNIIEEWLLHAMDVYDQKGLYPAREVIENIEQFIATANERTAGAVFEESAGILSHFAHGLAGRRLQLEEADETYTDSETIFLPPLIGRLPDAADNFIIYKAMVAYHWAQNRYGSFRLSLTEAMNKHDDPEAFLRLFHALDSVRLEAYLSRELPGLFREMQRIRETLNETCDDTQWQEVTAVLQSADKNVDDVLALTNRYIGKLSPPEPCFYQGRLFPEKIDACMQARIAKEKQQLKSILRKITEEIKTDQDKPLEDYQFEASTKQQSDNEFDFSEVELSLDGQPMPLPEQARALTTSIVQDLGQLPEDYLTPAGDADYDPNVFHEQEEDPDEVWRGAYHEKGAFLYNEWDFKRQHYRKNWCAVREKDVSPVYDDFYQQTMDKYSGFIKQLRKTFEAMRDENRMLKRQAFGEGIDIDALVEALADAKDGSEMSDRLFTRMHRHERNIAVLFMVDMSGSTKGWINNAERESLILLTETIETLGDRYAIYGFSGMARKRCEIYRIKQFEENYNDEIRARIAGIQAKDYTRMGFAIRHLSKILNEVEAKTRILITISDGKPDDYDNYYRGEYGIEDTRRALLEARRDGIHPYCITIDKEGRDYLPHMYGPAAYTVIDEVSQLPLKVSDIYRRITT